MKYGVIITGGPVHEQVGLARAAEARGWDGVFTWTASERSMGRAARFDGLLPNVVGGTALTPELIGQMRDWVAERRGSLDGFDIVVEGTTEPGAPAEPARFAAGGATWWIESNWQTFDPADARRRIEAGPPRG